VAEGGSGGGGRWRPRIMAAAEDVGGSGQDCRQQLRQAHDRHAAGQQNDWPKI